MTWSVANNYPPDPFVTLEHPVTKLCGQWEFSGTIWPDDNDLTLTVPCKGKANVKPAADGRFLHIEWDGAAANDTWSGGTIIGYGAKPKSANGDREIHESFYNKYGSFGKSTGTRKIGSNRIETAGETHCYDRGPETYRHIIEIVSDNEFLMEVHIQGKAGESIARKLVFKRA